MVRVDSLHEDGFRATLRAVVHGVEIERSLGSEFFRSAEYRSLVQLSAHLNVPLAEEALVRRGDKSKTAASLAEAMTWLLSEAKRGVHIQRYKGLGEMNPEQLWETTMNPDSRRLLQVRVEDAVAADELFTTLMGDQVEPRRDFIESNALSVANLDA
jgi:DNA gyrase subunit B